MRAKWIDALGGPNSVTCKRPVICSLHFKRQDFKPTIAARLNDDAVPQIYPTSYHGKYFSDLFCSILLINSIFIDDIFRAPSEWHESCFNYSKILMLIVKAIKPLMNV